METTFGVGGGGAGVGGWVGNGQGSVGTEVDALWPGEGNFYPATIVAYDSSQDKYQVNYVGFDNTQNKFLSTSQIAARGTKSSSNPTAVATAGASQQMSTMQGMQAMMSQNPAMMQQMMAQMAQMSGMQGGMQMMQPNVKPHLVNWKPCIRVIIHNRHLGRMIGRGGVTIRGILEDSGASVDIEQHKRRPDGHHPRYRIVTVFGDTYNVMNALDGMLEQTAQIEFEDTQEKGRPKIAQYPYEMWLLVDKNMLGLVIGSGGSMINQIRDESGANLFISKQAVGSPENPSTEKCIKVGGDYEATTSALHDLINILMRRPRPPEDPYHPEVHGYDFYIFDFNPNQPSWKRRRN